MTQGSNRRLRNLGWAPLVLLIVASGVAAGTGQPGAGATRGGPARCDPWPPSAALPTVRFPDPDLGAKSIEAWRRAQLGTLSQFEVFHQFEFADRAKESGITFLQRPVDDAGKDSKAVHYDHGTGLAVADVDGDGLHDVYFVNQLGGNQLWKNLGNGRFEDITAEAGVAVSDRISVSASFADLDNRGYPDLYVVTVRGGNVLFRNDGQGHFTDVSKESRLDHVGHSSAAVFFDYDNDGLLDLFLVNVGRYTTDARGCGGYYIGREDAFFGHLYPERTEYSRLFRNLGQHRFADVSKETGLLDGSWSGDASFADLNGDRYPDLYVVNMQGQNHYYENQHGKRFVDKTLRYFPKTPFGAMGLKFFDWNNDALMDLLVTDMHSDMLYGPPPDKEKTKLEQAAYFLTRKYPKGLKAEAYKVSTTAMFGNAFYENRGGGRFVEVSDKIGAENYWPWGVSTGDLNADGWEDVFITSGMGFPHRYGVNTLLLNNRGKKLLDAEFILHVEPRRDGLTMAPRMEFDCSSPAKDAATAKKNRLYCGGQTGRITVMGTVSSRSSAIFDLDGDGDLDIVTNEFGWHPMVLLSDLARRKPLHWAQVKLVGTRSNRQGLGATVQLVAGGTTYTKYSDGKSGYLSQSALPLYFGLGDAIRIDRIEVRWPSGKDQVVTTGLTPNSTITVVEER